MIEIKKTKGLIMSGPLAVETHYGRKTVTRRVLNHGFTEPTALFDQFYDEKGIGYVMGTSTMNSKIVRPKYQRGDWCYIREPFTARGFADDVDHSGGRLELNHAFWQDIPRPFRKPNAVNWVCYRGDMSFWYVAAHEDEEVKKQYPLLHLIASEHRNNEISEFKKHRWYAGRFMPKWMGRTLVRIVDVHPERLKEIDDADAALEGFPLRSVQYPIQGNNPRAHFAGYWDKLHGLGHFNQSQDTWVWRYEWQLAQVEPFAHWPETNEGAHYDHDAFYSMPLKDF